MLSPFVVSTCNSLSTASSSLPRLIAGTLGHSKEGQLDTCTLLLFSCALLVSTFGVGLYGHSGAELFPGAVSVGSVEMEYRTLMKGENIPSSSTQCLLLDLQPADCDLF